MTVSGCQAAVVLAGGESRRFGSDKLDAAVGGRSLLDRAVQGLPTEMLVLVVGPERPLHRPVRFVREEPPGGGPAAAMVTGLRAALDAGADLIVVLPGDAPSAGAGATALVHTLVQTGATAVVGTDATGFDQPLQLALTRAAAAALVAAAGPEGARGRSARRLVNTLDPPALRQPLTTSSHWDVDTPEQLQAWLGRDSRGVRTVLAAVDALGVADRPIVVALDGRSGSGKSVLARAIALQRQLTVLEGDDFYAPGLASLDLLARERMTDAQVADAVIDWRRLRDEALDTLSRGEPTSYRRYDWAADDGRLGDRVDLPANDLVVLEGVYSGRPELADLVDLAVVVDVDEEVRLRRLSARGHDTPQWTGFWERGESYYFACVRQVEEFDLRFGSSDLV